MTTRKALSWTRAAGLVALALLLPACSDNDGGNVVSGSMQQGEDVAASASVAGLVQFAQVAIAQPDADTSEPLPVAGIDPPVSDDTEPAAI